MDARIFMASAAVFAVFPVRIRSFRWNRASSSFTPLATRS